MREVSIEIRRDTIRQHKHQLELLQSRNPLQGLAVLDPLQDSLIDNLIRRAIDSRVCWTMEDGPEAVEILRDVDVDVEVLEAFAFREAGKCLVGESGAGGTEVDVEGYGADGVSVEGVDDAEVVEEEGGTVKGEGLESVEEAAADEVDVDLAGELVEFGCFLCDVGPARTPEFVAFLSGLDGIFTTGEVLDGMLVYLNSNLERELQESSCLRNDRCSPRE